MTKKKKHMWKNRQGVAFEIQPVPIFLEDEIRSNFTFPQLPTYQFTQEDPMGKSFAQTMSYGEFDLTEIDHEPETTPPELRITEWKFADGNQLKPLRWLEESDPHERQKWRAYKLTEAKVNQEMMDAILRETLVAGVVITDDELNDWKIKSLSQRRIQSMDTFQLRHAYILREMLTHEDELIELYLAIQEIRGLSEERLALIKDSFRNNLQPEAAK